MKLIGSYTFDIAVGLKMFFDINEYFKVGYYNGVPSIFMGFYDIENREKIEFIGPSQIKDINNFDIYLYRELNEEEERLINHLDYIKEKFDENKYNSLFILPTNSISKSVTDKTKFYSIYNNGKQEFVLHSNEKLNKTRTLKNNNRE
ncbi:MAG: hypothetical protein PHX40_00430 [Bacilli bacterium]|nr:hypothetical protein [Bacilli bacterium]